MNPQNELNCTADKVKMHDTEKSLTLQAQKTPRMSSQDDKPNTLPAALLKKKKRKAPQPTPRAASIANQNTSNTAVGAVTPDSWRVRSADKAEEILQLYLTSQLSDCTFTVGKEGQDPMVFKCHKTILASASSFLEKLLFGEPGKGEKLSVQNLSPTSFDYIMRHIYGNRFIIPSPEIGVEMCKTAHSWKLHHLAKATERYLIKNTKQDDILLVYEMFCNLGKVAEIEHCMKEIQMSCEYVVQTKHWLVADKATVNDVLYCCRELLHVHKKFQALVAWGTAQMKLEEGSGDCKMQIRDHIDPFLPLVGLETLTASEFALHYSGETVLSADEKLSLLVELVLKQL